MSIKKFVKKGLFILLALAAALYILLLAGLWAFQNNLMFGRRTSAFTEMPSDRGWAYEDVWAALNGETTHGWWLPVENARGAVLFSHGSGRNISGYLQDAEIFRTLGLSVLLYDYGGYGASSGAPSEARCYADALGMWNHLVQERGIAPEKIVLAGSSMGGGVTAGLAAQVAPAGVILESSFTSVPNLLAEQYPFIPARWLCRIRFNNIDRIGDLRCPVLIVHSRDDAVTPFRHGERLYERVTAAKRFVEIRGAHYGGKFTSRETYTAGLKTFFDEYVQLTGSMSSE